MFYQGKDPVHQTMRRLARRLEKANISYVIVGGMAVFAHNHRRATNDVDVLMTREGFAEFRKSLVKRNYKLLPGATKRFTDRLSGITIDILITGLFPGSGDPGPIAFPDPANIGETMDKIRVVNLVTLIELKLAARRPNDFGDVVALIRVHKLTESFADNLHSSVRRDFVGCIDEARRQQIYEARNL
jgi:hypothetical protein